MVDLELYRIFVVVASECNITKASSKLNISQPAVTKYIKKLEDLLNTKLFERSNKGLVLTKTGEDLYIKLKPLITEINRVDKEFSESKNINLGSHNHLLNVVFGESIKEFYFKYPNVNVNLINLETDEMLRKLNDKELDIVFSKKCNSEAYKNIKYIELGYLNDIFIISKNNFNKDKKLSKDEIKNKTIYVPRIYAQTVHRLNELMNNEKLNIRNSSYNTILELVSKTNSIGLITKEYIDENKLEEYNLLEQETELDLMPVSYGIYINNNRIHEVNELIKIIKQNNSRPSKKNYKNQKSL